MSSKDFNFATCMTDYDAEAEAKERAESDVRVADRHLRIELVNEALDAERPMTPENLDRIIADAVAQTPNA